MYFDHCARRSPDVDVDPQQRLPPGGRPTCLQEESSLGAPSGGGAEVPVGIVYSRIPATSATVAAPVLPVASQSSVFAASRTTGSGKGHGRRRSRLLLLLLHDREGTVTVVRLQLTIPPCAGTAGKAFSPGGYLMSIWGWD